MFKRLSRVFSLVMVVALIATTAAWAAAIDPLNRTVTTPKLFLDWSETNPEEILDVQYMGSANLTNVAANENCPAGGDLEFFGNAWVSENEGTPDFVFVSLVGWGSTGTWDKHNKHKVYVHSESSGCPGSAEVPVFTKYKFFDRGQTANRFRMQRRFDFGSTAFAHDVRPYIPRLYPMDGYTQVIHPDALGTTLLTEDSTVCDFGCEVTDWNGLWFAIHNPTTGDGLIVRRGGDEPASASLWVDQDTASFTNASSVLLKQPEGGFTGFVNEVEFMCFYNSARWTPSLELPPAC